MGLQVRSFARHSRDSGFRRIEPAWPTDYSGSGFLYNGQLFLWLDNATVRDCLCTFILRSPGYIVVYYNLMANLREVNILELKLSDQPIPAELKKAAEQASK